MEITIPLFLCFGVVNSMSFFALFWCNKAKHNNNRTSGSSIYRTQRSIDIGGKKILFPYFVFPREPWSLWTWPIAIRKHLSTKKNKHKLKQYSIQNLEQCGGKHNKISKTLKTYARLNLLQSFNSWPSHSKFWLQHQMEVFQD